MKVLLIVLATLLTGNTFAQDALYVYDISQKQLRVIEQYKNYDSVERSKIFIDSIYSPYKTFWNGYSGDANHVAEWLSEAIAMLPQWKKKNKTIDGSKLLKQFRKVAKDMEKLTGYAPKGNWYIVYGPGWTDLGSLGSFAMLIDLSHENNSSNGNIVRTFPHELTHQIMTNVNKHKDTTAISSIIGEGFAVWMNQKYWKQKFTLAQNLGYTEDELKECERKTETLKKFFSINKYSVDPKKIDVFRNRSKQLDSKLPGAIGYFIGYRIVENYVQKNGVNSWKDVFTKPPQEIYEMSGFFE